MKLKGNKKALVLREKNSDNGKMLSWEIAKQ